MAESTFTPNWRGGAATAALLCALHVQSADAQTTYYVRAGASGSQTGASWTDAFQRLPASPVRGATYYVASGTYPGGTFSTPAAGAEWIVIKGATVADHGADVGWLPAFSVSPDDGGAQAVWTSTLVFNTSYWRFDGAVGAVHSRDKSRYGFKINPLNIAVEVFNLSSTIDHITLSHLTATAPPGDVEKLFLVTHNSTRSVHSVVLSHCLLDGWTNTMWATSAGLAMNDWVVEYNVILNGYSSATWHGEDINNNYGRLSNLVVRYNWFEGRESGTGTIVVLNGAAGPYFIYGNVFKNQTSGDGTIAAVHFPMEAYIYNNVFTALSGGPWIGGAVTGEAFNNIFYTTNAAPGGATSVTREFNAFFSTTNTPAEANRYVGTGSPFADVAAGDLRLSPSVASVLPAGRSLSAEYSLDPFGNRRGADGRWDRGAFEFGSTSVRPASPTSLTIRP